MEPNPGDAPLATDAFAAFDSPVRIHIHSIRKRLVDADGISAKAVIDGLVACGLLRDDSPAFVAEVSYSQAKGKDEKTIVTIAEIGLDGIIPPV